jgi:YfiH family protein
VYFWRGSRDPVDLAFTDAEVDVALDAADPAARAEDLRRVVADFAPGATFADMRQVHGNRVAVVDGPGAGGASGAPQGARPEVDALVTTVPDVVLVVRAADCVPVLLADATGGVVAAVHAGRPGLVAGVVGAAVARMRAVGAGPITAWVGPHVCGGCYEVPEDMRAEVGAVVPESVATTTWGTPALDLGAGVTAQLRAEGVAVVDVAACTRERLDLHSYRRDGSSAGRLAGLVRRRQETR